MPQLPTLLSAKQISSNSSYLFNVISLTTSAVSSVVLVDRRFTRMFPGIDHFSSEESLDRLILVPWLKTKRRQREDLSEVYKIMRDKSM